MNPFAVSSSKQKTMITTLNRISRELLKVRHGINTLDLQTQELEVNLHSFMRELKKKNEVGQPIILIEESQNHKGNEMNLDLPSYEVAKEEVAKEDEIKDKKEGRLVAYQE